MYLKVLIENCLTLLQGLINNLISIGLGRESAFSAAVLGDNMLMEKAWQDTGMLAEAVLHAHVRFSLFYFVLLQFVEINIVLSLTSPTVIIPTGTWSSNSKELGPGLE